MLGVRWENKFAPILPDTFWMPVRIREIIILCSARQCNIPHHRQFYAFSHSLVRVVFIIIFHQPTSTHNTIKFHQNRSKLKLKLFWSNAFRWDATPSSGTNLHGVNSDDWNLYFHCLKNLKSHLRNTVTARNQESSEKTIFGVQGEKFITTRKNLNRKGCQ